MSSKSGSTTLTYCPNCGAQITEEDALFCSICGFRLYEAPQNWVQGPGPQANRRRRLWPWFALAAVVALVAVALAVVLVFSPSGADITIGEIQQLVHTHLETTPDAVQVFDHQSDGDWAAAWVGTEPQGSLEVFRREGGRWVVVRGDIPGRQMTVEDFPRVTTMSVDDEYKLMRSAGLPDRLSEWIAQSGMADE